MQPSDTPPQHREGDEEIARAWPEKWAQAKAQERYQMRRHWRIFKQIKAKADAGGHCGVCRHAEWHEGAGALSCKKKPSGPRSLVTNLFVCGQFEPGLVGKDDA